MNVRQFRLRAVTSLACFGMGFLAAVFLGDAIRGRMDFGTLATAIKDIGLTVGASVGAWVAYQGLSTWQRQLKGNANYELARRLLRATYKTRDLIQSTRNGNPSHEQASQAITEQGIDVVDDGSTTFQRAGYKAAYAKQLKVIAAAMSDLHLEVIEAEALWGDKDREIRKAFALIARCIMELAFNLDRHLAFVGRVIILPDDQAVAEERDAIWRVIYRMQGYPEPNPFTISLEKAVEEIEKFARPHLID